METNANIPSGKHTLEVHVPTILLSMMAMCVILAALAAGYACMEQLYKWCMDNQHQDTRNTPMAAEGPTGYIQPETNKYEQTIHHSEINESKTKTKQTTTRSTSTKARKCHKTTNTDDGVSALIAAGNKWTEDNRIEG